MPREGVFAHRDEVCSPHPQAQQDHRGEGPPRLPGQRLHTPDEGVGGTHLVADHIGNALLDEGEQIEHPDAKGNLGAGQEHKAQDRQADIEVNAGEVRVNSEGVAPADIELGEARIEAGDDVEEDKAIATGRLKK